MVIDVCFFLLIMAVFHLCYQSKIFLNILLVFELLTFLVFSVGVFLRGVSLRMRGFHVCILILCLGVTETVIGLAVLISCSRKTGKVKVAPFRFLKF